MTWGKVYLILRTVYCYMYRVRVIRLSSKRSLRTPLVALLFQESIKRVKSNYGIEQRAFETYSVLTPSNNIPYNNGYAVTLQTI